MRLVRQHGQRGVIPHRSDRIFARRDHRTQENPEILVGVAKNLLPTQHGLVIGKRLVDLCLRQILDRHEMLVQPLLVRVCARNLVLQLFVADDASLFRVDQKHASRLKSIFMKHAIRGDIEHTDFGSEDDKIVLGHVIAGRPQPVPVQHGPDTHPVGERDRGGTVPRFHQTAVILIEGTFSRGHALVVFPRLRNHHHHDVGNRAACQGEEFQRIVENRGVAALRVLDHRHNLFQVVAEEVGGKVPLTREHPVDVAPLRVDLTVVDHHPVWMRQLPAGECIRAET